MLATAGFSTHAEGISIYALLDASVASTSISGAGTTANKTEFVTGGYAPNFFGITGEKSLSGGLSGGFKLEQGFLLNPPPSGNSRFAFGADSLFNRRANLYLKGIYGTGTIGTQGNIAFDSVLLGDARFGSNYGSSLAAIVISGGLNTNDDAALAYTSPTFSGFTVKAQALTETKDFKGGGRLAGTYASGPLKATLAFYTTDVITETKNRTGTIAGVNYKIGAFEVKALYASQKTATFDALNTVGVGGAYFMSDKITIDAGLFNTTDSNTNYKMDTIGAGVQYMLVKDLTAYAQYAYVKNNGTPSTPFNFAPPTLLTGSITAGQTASTFNVGLLYSFF
jgi:predicted porin